MTDVSPAEVPPTANFINPDTMHRPTGYTHVVEITAGRPVYFAGQVALDGTGALVGPGDIRAQTGQVFDNLRTALQAVGARFDQVVKLNYYLVDATQLPVVREVRDEYLNPQRLPASTAVEVPQLFRDDCLIEVEAVAVIASFQPMSSTAEESGCRASSDACQRESEPPRTVLAPLARRYATCGRHHASIPHSSPRQQAHP